MLIPTEIDMYPILDMGYWISNIGYMHGTDTAAGSRYDTADTIQQIRYSRYYYCSNRETPK